MGSSRLAGSARDLGFGVRAQDEQRWRWLTAQLRTALATYQVRVCDLSPMGARVQAERLPDSGMLVCLQRGAAVVFGMMAWAEDGQGSVLFDEELDVQLFGGTVEAERDDGETLAQAKARLERVSRR